LLAALRDNLARQRSHRFIDWQMARVGHAISPSVPVGARAIAHRLWLVVAAIAVAFDNLIWV
jgi:hypothetical protein